jgi:hypothetical protein
MSTLHRLAHFQNRRDEAPNVELAASLAAKNDRKGIREIVENLRHESPDVQADCVKVLYEVGARNPELIAEYASDFLKLLKSKNNQLVWGGMTALGASITLAHERAGIVEDPPLGAIAVLKPGVIYKHRDSIIDAIDHGSVITVDQGIQTLALAPLKPSGTAQAYSPF